MPHVQAREDESIDSVMRRFKRLVDKSGLPKEVRKREFHVKNSKLKQKRIAAAKKRWQKKLARERAIKEALQGPASKRSHKSSSSSNSRGRFGNARGRTGSSSNSSSNKGSSR